MDSKTLFLSLLMISCGSGGNAGSGIVGESLDNSTPLYNAYGIQSESAFVVDEPSQRILKVDVNSMTIQNTYALSRPDYEHTLAAAPDGSYVIDFSTKHLEVITAEGSRESRPFAFQGTPVSAAYNPSKGILVMQDDLQSLGLMMLSSTGKILKSWLGGPLIGAGKSLVAGDIDSSGRLALAVSDDSIAVVDVEKSIDASSWQSESFASGTSEINWLAPDPDHPDLMLVLAKDSIAIINLQTKSVTEKIELASQGLAVAGKAKLVKPHIFTSHVTTGRERVHFIDSTGKLSAHELPETTRKGYSVSYLSANARDLTVLFSQIKKHTVTRLRLSDNLVSIDETVEASGDVQLGSDVLFVNRKSTLGYLQARKLSDGTSKEIKGFNFDYFRNN